MVNFPITIYKVSNELYTVSWLTKTTPVIPPKHAGRWEGGRAAGRVEERKEGRRLNK